MGIAFSTGCDACRTASLENDVISQEPLPFGNYYLLERIAVGGMAEVYLAKCFGAAGFETLVALKRILPNIAEQDEFIEMFIDEAKITGQLTHPNIAKTFDLGHVNESYFIAMEYIAGHDLRELWEQNRSTGGLPIPQACHIVQRICDALDYAHKRQDGFGNPLNIVHRDVSPQNVLISYDGDVKVIDFGIAKAENRLSHTANGILKGKFAYMSPEQARGQAADQRSDIFAIGLIFYELLTGERAFQALTDYELLEKVRQADVVSPREHVPGLPRQLEHIVMNALTVDPDNRYPTAADFADAIENFIDSRGLFFERDDLGAVMQDTFALEWQEEEERVAHFNSFQPKPVSETDVESPTTEEIAQGERYMSPERAGEWMARESAAGKDEQSGKSAGGQAPKNPRRADTYPDVVPAADLIWSQDSAGAFPASPEFDFSDESVSTTDAGRRRHDGELSTQLAESSEGSTDSRSREALRLVAADEFVVLGEASGDSSAIVDVGTPLKRARTENKTINRPEPELRSLDEEGSLVDLIEQVRAHNLSKSVSSTSKSKPASLMPAPKTSRPVHPPKRKSKAGTASGTSPAKAKTKAEATATTRLRRDRMPVRDERTLPVARKLDLPPVLSEGSSQQSRSVSRPVGERRRSAALMVAAFVIGLGAGGSLISWLSPASGENAPNVLFSATQPGWSVQESGQPLCDALPCAVYLPAGMHSFAFVEKNKVVVRQEVQVPEKGSISLSPSHHALGHLAWAKEENRDEKPASASELTRWTLVLEPEDAKAILPNGSLVARSADVFVDYGNNVVLRIERPGCRGEVLVLEGNGDSFADRHLALDCEAFTSRLVVMPDAPSTVEIDGVLMASEARAVDLELPAGSHFITVRQAFRAETFVVEIEPDERLVFPARLAK